MGRVLDYISEEDYDAWREQEAERRRQEAAREVERRRAPRPDTTPMGPPRPPVLGPPTPQGYYGPQQPMGPPVPEEPPTPQMPPEPTPWQQVWDTRSHVGTTGPFLAEGSVTPPSVLDTIRQRLGQVGPALQRDIRNPLPVVMQGLEAAQNVTDMAGPGSALTIGDDLGRLLGMRTDRSGLERGSPEASLAIAKKAREEGMLAPVPEGWPRGVAGLGGELANRVITRGYGLPVYGQMRAAQDAWNEVIRPSMEPGVQGPGQLQEDWERWKTEKRNPALDLLNPAGLVNPPRMVLRAPGVGLVQALADKASAVGAGVEAAGRAAREAMPDVGQAARGLGRTLADETGAIGDIRRGLPLPEDAQRLRPFAEDAVPKWAPNNTPGEVMQGVWQRLQGKPADPEIRFAADQTAQRFLEAEAARVLPAAKEGITSQIKPGHVLVYRTARDPREGLSILEAAETGNVAAGFSASTHHVREHVAQRAKAAAKRGMTPIYTSNYPSVAGFYQTWNADMPVMFALEVPEDAVIYTSSRAGGQTGGVAYTLNYPDTEIIIDGKRVSRLWHVPSETVQNVVAWAKELDAAQTQGTGFRNAFKDRDPELAQAAAAAIADLRKPPVSLGRPFIEASVEIPAGMIKSGDRVVLATGDTAVAKGYRPIREEHRQYHPEGVNAHIQLQGYKGPQITGLLDGYNMPDNMIVRVLRPGERITSAELATIKQRERPRLLTALRQAKTENDRYIAGARDADQVSRLQARGQQIEAMIAAQSGTEGGFALPQGVGVEAAGGFVGAAAGYDPNATPEENARRMAMGGIAGAGLGYGAKKGLMGLSVEDVSKGKVSAKTGFTKGQEQFLANEVKKVAPSLPESFTKEQTALLAARFEQRVPSDIITPEQYDKWLAEKPPAPTLPADMPKASIAVPGDGTVTVYTQEQANNLHKLLTGKAIGEEDAVKPIVPKAVPRGKPYTTPAEFAEYTQPHEVKAAVSKTLGKDDFVKVRSATLDGDPAWSNGFMLDKGELPGGRPFTTDNPAGDGRRFIVKGPGQKAIPLGYLGEVGERATSGQVVLGLPGGKLMAVEDRYLGYFMRKYGNPDFIVRRPGAPIEVQVNGEVVGLVMPMTLRPAEMGNKFSKWIKDAPDIPWVEPTLTAEKQQAMAAARAAQASAKSTVPEAAAQAPEVAPPASAIPQPEAAIPVPGPVAEMQAERIGDFYILRGQDATQAAKELDLEKYLVQRRGEAELALPYHSVDNYRQQLADKSITLQLPDEATTAASDVGREDITKGKPSAKTVSDFLAGRKSARIGTLVIDGRESLPMTLAPDTSTMGAYSIIVHNPKATRGQVSRTYRMQYKGKEPLEETLRHFEEYMNTDNPGRYKVEMVEAKPVVPKAEPGQRTQVEEWRKELKERQSKRFKTANDTLQIERLKAKIALDPVKWQAGQGVGWRLPGQINRGFRIVEVYPEKKQALIRSIADTGLTTTGGDYDKINDELVDMIDLLRDKKYDKAGAPTKAASAEAGASPVQTPRRTDTQALIQYIKDNVPEGERTPSNPWWAEYQRRGLDEDLVKSVATPQPEAAIPAPGPAPSAIPLSALPTERILQTPDGQPIARLRQLSDQGRGMGTYEVIEWLGGDVPGPYGPKGQTYRQYFEERVTPRLLDRYGNVSHEGADKGYLQLMGGDQKYLSSAAATPATTVPSAPPALAPEPVVGAAPEPVRPPEDAAAALDAQAQAAGGAGDDVLADALDRLKTGAGAPEGDVPGFREALEADWNKQAEDIADRVIAFNKGDLEVTVKGYTNWIAADRAKGKEIRPEVLKTFEILRRRLEEQTGVKLPEPAAIPPAAATPPPVGAVVPPVSAAPSPAPAGGPAVPPAATPGGVPTPAGAAPGGPAVPPPVTPGGPPPTPPGPAAGPPIRLNSWLPSMKPTDEIIDAAYQPDWMRRLADRLDNVIVRPIAQALGVPQRDVFTQGLVLRESIIADGKSAVVGAMSRLRAQGSSTGLFKVTNDIATLTDGTKAPINDILEHPNNYTLTPEQRQWTVTIHKLYDDQRDLLTAEGITINELEFEPGGHYVGRRVVFRENPDGSIDMAQLGSGVRRPGAKASFEKTRSFDTIADAKAEGFHYATPEEALNLNLEAAYRRIADQRLANHILSQIPYRTGAAPDALKVARDFAKQKREILDKLTGVINRGYRGERVPDSTVASIGRFFPNEAKDLIAAGITKPEDPILRAKLQKVEKRVPLLTAQAKADYYQAQNALTEASEQAKKAHFGESGVQAPAFQGKFFSEADAKRIRQVLDLEPQSPVRGLARSISWINALPRALLTTVDVGTPFLQGGIILFSHPVVWTKTVEKMVEALVPKAGEGLSQQFLRAHAATIQKWSPEGAIFTPSEFTTAFQRGGIATKVPVFRGMAMPFVRAYEQFLNAARIYGLEATERLAKTPEDRAGLAKHWNEMTGQIDTARMGISATQREIETAALFAPRYRRAIIALMTDISKGGLRGDQARRSLATASLAGLLGYVGVSYMLGQEPKLDPRDPKFLTVNVFDQNIGIGGAFVSTIKAMAQMALQPDKGHEIAYKYIRNQASPLVGTGIRRLEYPYLYNTPLKMTKEMIVKNMVPIWAQGWLIEGQSGMGAVVGSAVEAGGGKAFADRKPAAGGNKFQYPGPPSNVGPPKNINPTKFPYPGR